MFVVWVLISATLLGFVSSDDGGFTYNGFHSVNLSLDGSAEITPNGLLKLTKATRLLQGHAFYPFPINFKTWPSDSVVSFSTNFVFAIVPEYSMLNGHGLTFAITPARGIPGARPSIYLGLFNATNNGNDTNHVVAVEFDTLQSIEFNDIDDNHVGIDINDLKSAVSKSACYYDDRSNSFRNLSLVSGKPIKVWIEYDGKAKQMNVTIAPIHAARPSKPILSLRRDLSSVIHETMFVGFTSATGAPAISTHYILGWSFNMSGTAQEIDPSKLPRLPRVGPKKKSRVLMIGLPMILIVLLIVVASGLVCHISRKRMFREVLEDWELEYRPHRFKYKELYTATSGFSEKELLGAGGFGRVYKGTLHSSRREIAVKKVSHETRHGMRAFITEIVSLGRLCHRNLVPLLGYCRRKGELLLVYEYMSNGSLDKYLYGEPKCSLPWERRFQVIKGVASALVYLHEEWEQLVVHRDIKASNVLLDNEWNGRLGDFGLAKLYDHGTDPQTTHIVGTLGYLAPEHIRTGKGTPNTDVFAFGAFLLEVACGRRPIEQKGTNENFVLVEWVFSCWSKGEILNVVDPKLRMNYVAEEADLVLKLGLLCSLLEPTSRPSMRQIVMYLEGSIAPPELSSLSLSTAGLTIPQNSDFGGFLGSLSFSGCKSCSYCTSVENSVLSGGR